MFKPCTQYIGVGLFSTVKVREFIVENSFFVKHQLAATKAKFDGDTQKLRRELIIDLLFLKEYTSRRSNDRRLSDKNRIKWIQVTAKITRTISYISKDLDTIDIKKRIEELQKILDTTF